MGPVSAQMRIMRIALAKAQALPSTIDERLAKIRKASLTTQKKSRDFASSLNFSPCVSMTIVSKPYFSFMPRILPYSSQQTIGLKNDRLVRQCPIRYQHDL